MPVTLFTRIKDGIEKALPLFKYLVLKTETHAFCGSLAFFTLLGFYPFCFLLLALAKQVFHWSSPEEVIVFTLSDYYPTGKEFLLRNLQVSVSLYGDKIAPGSVFWVLLGAAGFFVPLEAAFNRLWNFKDDRPYWRNQIIGFLLTSACCALAVFFILCTAVFYSAISRLIFWELPARVLRYVSFKISAICFSVSAIFLFYKFLPNGKVHASQVLPAAILAGVIAEGVRWIYLLALPFLQLQKSQGPYYVSLSFALLAYVEAFVLMGGAFLATGSRRIPAGKTLTGQMR
jgi:uncharacterized BrkB/YihY/UPF0761 family membrane protein